MGVTVVGAGTEGGDGGEVLEGGVGRYGVSVVVVEV